MCIDVIDIWFGIATGQISICDSYLSATCLIFCFLDDKLSKYQWIFTKLGMCIDIVEIWFGIANEKISSFYDELTVRDTSIFFVSGWQLE